MSANWPSRTILFRLLFGLLFVCCCLRFLDAIQMESFWFCCCRCCWHRRRHHHQLRVYKTTLTDCHITIHHLLNDADNKIRPIFLNENNNNSNIEHYSEQFAVKRCQQWQCWSAKFLAYFFLLNLLDDLLSYCWAINRVDIKYQTYELSDRLGYF